MKSNHRSLEGPYTIEYMIVWSLKKISSRWIPHVLTEQNHKERVRICKQNLDKFKSSKWRLYGVVTGDRDDRNAVFFIGILVKNNHF